MAITDVDREHASSNPGFTELLAQWSEGDDPAFERIAPLAYDHLRELAHIHLGRERRNHTLQATDLLHDVYLELSRQRGLVFSNRAQFFGLTACLMRRALVDHGRRRSARKRGGDRQRVPFDEVLSIALPMSESAVALDNALETLAKFDQQKAKIVELRFFAGLTVSEVAECIGLSPRTVAREWKLAKALLRRLLSN